MTTSYDLLTMPMPPEQIKHHPSGGYAYFEFGDVARRVIEATGNCYDWLVIAYGKEQSAKGETYWWVHGRMSIAELGTRDGMGVHWPQGGERNPQDSEAIKAAETDAFKRAASKFGVALELYDADRRTADKPSSNGQRPSEGNWLGPGQCPRCHAPEGKKHATPCV